MNIPVPWSPGYTNLALISKKSLGPHTLILSWDLAIYNLLPSDSLMKGCVFFLSPSLFNHPASLTHELTESSHTFNYSYSLSAPCAACKAWRPAKPCGLPGGVHASNPILKLSHDVIEVFFLAPGFLQGKPGLKRWKHIETLMCLLLLLPITTAGEIQVFGPLIAGVLSKTSSFTKPSEWSAGNWSQELCSIWCDTATLQIAWLKYVSVQFVSQIETPYAVRC